MDDALLAWLNETLAHSLLDAVMPLASTVGLALCPAAGAALLVGPRRRLGAALLAALAVGLALTLAVQYATLRPRPNSVRLLGAAPNFPSFPSGHAMAAGATAMVLSLGLRRRGVMALLWMGATLVCASRVYLGHHYPSDVVAGCVLGAGVGAAAYGWLVANEPGWRRLRWLLWPQLSLIVVISLAAYLGRLPLSLLRLPYTDKVLHFLLFGGVAFWLALWLGPRRLGPVPLAVGVPFGLALLEEGAQAFSPLRSAGLDDLAADLAGMVVFWCLSRLVRPADVREPHHQGTKIRI